MKKRRSKSESTRKTEQNRPFLEILTFGQKSTQKVKVKVNWSRVKVNSQSAHGSDPGGPGRVGPVNGQLGDVVLTRRLC